MKTVKNERGHFTPNICLDLRLKEDEMGFYFLEMEVYENSNTSLVQKITFNNIEKDDLIGLADRLYGFAEKMNLVKWDTK